jgi:hypothetical protein
LWCFHALSLSPLFDPSMDTARDCDKTIPVVLEMSV